MLLLNIKREFKFTLFLPLISALIIAVPFLIFNGLEMFGF
jgi:hypothetical protein